MALAHEINVQRAGGFVDQEREQPDQRIHRRPATDNAGQPRRHAGGGLGDFPGEHDQCLLVRMTHREFDHHFAAVMALAVGAVGGLAAQQLDTHVAVRRPAALAEHFRGLVDDRITDPSRLVDGIDAGDQATGGAAETIGVRGADLVLSGRRQAFGAVHLHRVPALLQQFDLSEIAHHVGQQVCARVTDFIQHLFAHRQRRDQPTGAFGFADDELAVGADFDDGKTDVFVVGHGAPVGEVAARALGAAFDDVPGQCRLGELVVVMPRPAELMHQRGADHRTVDHAPGDHDVRPRRRASTMPGAPR